MTKEEIHMQIKFEVQEYFDHFLEKTHPALMEAHFNACKHGKTVSRLKWSCVGAAVVLAIFLPTVGPKLLRWAPML